MVSDMLGVLNSRAQLSRYVPYVVFVAVRALYVIYHPTLCSLVCFVFGVHQQGPQSVDRCEVH